MKPSKLPQPPADELYFAGSLSAAEARKLQRQAEAGALVRVCKGVYAQPLSPPEMAALVRRNWPRVVGLVVPGGVVSHVSAFRGGILPSGELVLSHPASFNRKVQLPGLVLRVLRGPAFLPGDLPIQTSGLHFASRPRLLLENLGKKAIIRASREEVEGYLVSILNASGEKALNDIRDQAAALAAALGAERALEDLRSLIGALLGTHARGQLRTRQGLAVAHGTPVDQERLARFDVLAAHLRREPLPRLENHLTGLARQHFAFIESYFSNYVEGTKFDIEQARDIVMNQVIVPNRPKDSHDILGVFRLAITSPYRDSPPVAGPEFLEGLEAWHAEMLKMRPEANPGKPKLSARWPRALDWLCPSPRVWRVPSTTRSSSQRCTRSSTAMGGSPAWS